MNNREQPNKKSVKPNPEPLGMADETIVELYWSRDERAISETSKKYEKHLYVIAYNILYNRLDSEECVNDTYLDTWNRIPPTRPTHLRAFLSKITRDIAVDRYRQRTAEKRVPTELTVSLDELDECLTDGASLEEDFVLSELVRILNEYVKTLSAREELEFVCRYYYADQIKDIADMLCINRNTVAKDLAALREKLRERIEQEGLEV